MTSKEREWPIELYRFTESEGWQKQIAGSVAASPRKDCIVIPLLRQKFTLRGGEEKSSVIRRDRCLLLVSRRRTRAMAIKFKTRGDCLEFSDRFTELNKSNDVRHEDEIQALVPAREQDREEVLSYIAQLLHSEDFLSLVGKLESYLDNTIDGAKLLEGLKAN